MVVYTIYSKYSNNMFLMKNIIVVLGSKFPYQENENLGKRIGIKRFQKGVDLFKSLKADALIFAGSIELVHPITKKPFVF